MVAEGATGADLTVGGGRMVASWTEEVEGVDELHLRDLTSGRLGVEQRIDSGDVVVGLARKPSVALGPAGELAATWSTGDVRSSTVWLWAEGDAAPEAIAVAGPGEVPDWLDQPEVAFAPDGELWLLYKGQVDHPTMALFLGLRSNGYAPQRLDLFPGRPCECCPHRLDFTPGGDALITVRNDVLNLREIYVARADAGSTNFDRTAQVSHTGWFVQGCPFDGPRMAVRSDDELAVTWVDAASGVSRVWVARSDDGGASWSPEEAPLVDDVPWGFPAIADDGEALWVAAEEVGGHARVAVDRGQGFVEVPVEVGVSQVELAVTDQGVWLLGLDDDDTLWLQPLSD